MRDEYVDDALQEELTMKVKEAIVNGDAIKLYRSTIMGIEHPKIDNDSFAIHMRGRNINNEEKDFVVLVDGISIKDIFDMALVGLIHAEATRIAKDL